MSASEDIVPLAGARVSVDGSSWIHRSLQRIVSLAFQSLPLFLKHWLASAGAGELAINTLDIDQALLLAYNRLKRPPLDFPHVKYLKDTRATLDNDAVLVAGPTPTMLATLDLSIPRSAAAGQPESVDAPMACRLYIPHPGSNSAETESSLEVDGGLGLGLSLGLMVFFHGGGWVQGSVASHEGLAQSLAHHTGLRVLSVDYRLAPEHSFPAPLHDALAAYLYARSNRHALCGGSSGKDSSKLPRAPPIVLAGDSAGGNLAAVVARRAAELGCPADAQLLLYPVTDSAVERPSRCGALADGYFLTRSAMKFYEDCYLGELPGQGEGEAQGQGQEKEKEKGKKEKTRIDRRDPDISPLHASPASFATLPPTVVVTAGFDPLRDEGILYAEKVRAAGVACRHVHFEDCLHAFASFGCITQAKGRIEQMSRALLEVLATTSTTAAKKE